MIIYIYTIAKIIRALRLILFNDLLKEEFFKLFQLPGNFTRTDEKLEILLTVIMIFTFFTVLMSYDVKSLT